MTIDQEEISQMVHQLPPELQKEVRDFVRRLLEKHQARHGTKLRQDWAGALRDYRDQFTSLELQQKTLEWRGD